MKKVLLLILLCAATLAAGAQRITRQYHNISMSEALKELNSLQNQYIVNFIYDDLEDFKVTTTIRHLTVPDAIARIAGFYPIHITQKDNVLMVECTHRTKRHLTGKIIDEQGEPVPFANVVLLSVGDSAVISGGVSNESGVFVVPYEPTKIIAKVSYVGYKTVYRTYNSEEAGTIRLQPDTRTLQAVNVKALRPQYRMTRGGVGITVENTLLSDAGTARDVLTLLPRVNVDGDGNVTVFAKGSPEIYINNKLVHDKQDLTQLKSADIKSVDIITGPGAQYNATVKSVIRIHTKTKQGDCFSIRTDNNVKYNLYRSGFHEDYVKYRSGGFEVFADGYISTTTYNEDNYIWQDIYGTDHIRIDQHLKNNYRNNYLYGRIGTSFDFDENNSVGASYTLQKDFDSHGYAHNATQDIQRNNTLEAHIIQKYDTQENLGPSHEANAYYIGRLGKLSTDINLSYIWNKSSITKTGTEDSKEIESRNIHTYNTQHNRLIAGKLILSYPVFKGQLLWGTELSHTYSKGEYTNPEGYVDASLTEIKESHTAAFAEYDLPLGQWNINGGLRYEYVKSDYYSFDKHEKEPSRRYGNWFPTFSASWQKDLLGLQMGYACKTSRPNYKSLRSEVQYDNRYFYEGGNPYLVPTLTHAFDLALTYSWLSIGAGYSYDKDVMQECVTLYNNQNIGFVRNINFDRQHNVYASAVASPKLGWYQPTFEIDYDQHFFNAKGFGAERNLNRPNFSFSIQNRFVLPHDLTVLVNFRHNTDNHNGFMRSRHTSNLSLQLIKSFCKKAWTVNLKVTDLLKTDLERLDMYGIKATLGKDSYNYTRRASLTVTYNFNATRSKYKGTGAGNAEKQRL